MKKTFLTIILIAAAMGLNAQQPLFFHHRLENLSYQAEHPAGLPIKPMEPARAVNDFHQKLDSVIGSDNFDWTRWKNCYTYQGDTVTEISYEWQNQTWIPTVMSETFADQVMGYQWTDEGWRHYTSVTYQYMECGGQRLMESMTTQLLVDSIWKDYNKSAYEYDEQCNLLLNMNYSGVDESGEWIPASRYVYDYDSVGALTSCVYSTVRDGSWRESQKKIYSYNGQGQCESVLVQTKGGWGPFANSWMDSYRYDFEYEDGALASELYYASSGFGWFGGGSEMTLDSKSEYFFDANGNEERKTASIYNEQDWVVRDVYENSFDLSVNADEVLGMTPVWQNTLGRGMGFVLGDEMPLNNKWLSCTIVSSALDTHFDLYYSGFAAVGEHQETGMRAYARQGGFVVELDQPANITVYDLMGRVVASRAQTMQCEFSMAPGLYIVGNGTAMLKVVVR